ncbi:DUF2138 domain-containing protein [Salmonella enterica subsp. salamae]|uniref:DUF2138 domain-containing protein n=1 Tax=Salmonella enterica subsp. salamae TaxID=59202 RepID=A0A8E6IMA0_SALER|nr:DUF2138 domain-containing protein [Salmonella enterica]ECC1745057.1 DUF2138 domain-containing protein [Salmonella enterica subsp. salamae]ECG8596216.1 DUF2138 domain-containing protein [Salmonella enterica subsp. salamae]ECJ6093837.1 DUF2138 domain-containing protein [Salmonella enterica]EDN4182243.1 DUF2138 domain-containing protein [Salmonella enterica subsp. salamae]
MSVISTSFFRKKSVLVSAAVVIILAGGVATLAMMKSTSHKEPIMTKWVPHNNLQVDVTKPDVLIESRSLSQLPSDILTLPFLKNTLTEDFVFYYQNNADRLGIAGSLQRIIFEHQLTLKDSLINELLDQPAQIALWRDGKGKLNHFIMVIHRGGLAKMLEPLAHVVVDDSQLSKASPETIRIGDRELPLYKLRYNGQKTLLFASEGDNIVLLSSDDFLFNAQQQAADTTALVNDLLHERHPWDESFAMAQDTASPPQQRIMLRSSYLAMGYQRFIPAFAGLRLDKNPQGWRSYLELNDRDGSEEASLDFTPVWQAMPSGAGLCVALPLSRRMPAFMLRQSGATPEMAQQIGEQFSGTAGLCWYPQSRLYTPLLVAQLTQTPDAPWDDAAATLFSQFIGQPALPIDTVNHDDVHLWQREIRSRYAPYPASQSRHQDAPDRGRFFRASLAHYQQTVMFSLDDALVENATRTLKKNFPPMSDILPAGQKTALYLSPAKLADIFKQETYSSLPQEMEPIFYNAAQTLLYPRLTALAKEPAYAVALEKNCEFGSAPHWITLQWLPL